MKNNQTNINSTMAKCALTIIDIIEKLKLLIPDIDKEYRIYNGVYNKIIKYEDS